MKDFPVFTTDFGVSSLVLREVPYRQEAYIHIQDVQPGGLISHLAECVSFCRMVGAEKILATGHDELEQFPLHASIFEMRGTAWVDRQKLKNVFPVTEQTVSQWREICNRRLRTVDCSATQTSGDEKEILSAGHACFVHEEGELLGIGWIREDTLLVVASIKPGAGEAVMHSLMSIIEGSEMNLEVASTNLRAIRLYEKLGFVKTRQLRRWYDVTGCREKAGENG